MRMKDDHMKNGQLKPAYNVQIAVNSEYITGVDVFSNRIDFRTLISFLKRLQRQHKSRYTEVTADAGYESLENYLYLEANGQISFIKPSNYEAKKTKQFKGQMVWVCVAICVGVFAACLVTAGKAEAKRQKLQNLDGFGAVLVVVFFSLMLCIPSFGQNFGWSSKAFWGVLIAAAISLAGLLAAKKRAVHPILPGSFMKRGAFILSVLAPFLTQD